MAEKTLNTRLKLKFDTWAHWADVTVAGKGGNLVLLQGEAGVCQVPASSSAIQTANGKNQYIIKIGDGVTPFKDLEWLSAKAADVPQWAKEANKPSYSAGDVGAYTKTETDSLISATIASLDSSATAGTGKALKSVTIVDGKIIAHEDADLGDIDSNTTYQIVQNSSNGHQIKLQKKEKGETTWTDVTAWMTIPDNNTTYSFAEGNTNGAISVTPSNGSAQSVPVHGLGSAAYTESSAYATSAQGGKADAAQPKNLSSSITVDGTARSTVESALSAINTLVAAIKTTAGAAMPKSGGTFTGAITLSGAPTANLHPATKKYVDDLVAGIDQFRYVVSTSASNTPKGVTWDDDSIQTTYTGTLVASASTEFCIYLVPDNRAPSKGATGSYIEYLTVKIGSSYYWENIGTTRVDLSDYALIDTVTSKPSWNITANDINGWNNELGASYAVSVEASRAQGAESALGNRIGAFEAGGTHSVPAVESRVSTLEAKPGLSKTGTVTSVSAASNSGLKITGTATTTPTVDWDTTVTLILDCGNSTN